MTNREEEKLRGLLQKAENLEKLDNLLDSKIYGLDKNAEYKLRLLSFCDYYIEVELIVKPDYTLNKKVLIEEFEKGYKDGKIYVVNPSFCNKYFKQKWYRSVRNLN